MYLLEFMVRLWGLKVLIWYSYFVDAHVFIHMTIIFEELVEGLTLTRLLLVVIVWS